MFYELKDSTKDFLTNIFLLFTRKSFYFLTFSLCCHRHKKRNLLGNSEDWKENTS